MELGGEQEKAWDQRAGESNLWHKRFSLYLLMGPTRSLQAAYREEYARKHGGATTKKETASNWKTMASRWQWSQRAKAWDQEQLAMAGVALRNKMLALQEQRLDVTAELINRARTVLNNAHLEEADQAEARAMIAEMRMTVRDMAAVQQREYTLLPEDEDNPLHSAPITADDLRAAQREMERQDAEARAAAAQRTPAADGDEEPAEQTHRLPPQCAGDKPAPKLLVCTGNDHQAVLDIETLRELRAATGLQFQRVLSATRRKLADALELERKLHRPTQLLQVTLPASAEGITFLDQVADGAWLCKRLDGVQVLVLSDYRGEEQGEWLETVPHVVLLRTGIGAEEATVLVRKFWEGIGLGKEPAVALEEAIGCCAMEMRPFLEAVI